MRTLLLAAAVFAAVIVGTVVGAVYAATVFNRPLNTQVTIVPEPGFAYFSNAAATTPLTSLALGEVTRGESANFSFYVKNTSLASETITAGASTLAEGVGVLHLTIGGLDEKTVLAGEVVPVQGSLATSDAATPGSVDFTISFNATTVASGGTPGETPAPTPTPAPVSYASTIQPILNSSCTGCHGSAAGVTLTSYATTISVVTPGNASGSLLYKSLTGDGVTRMPMGSPLSASQIQSVANWINQGALNN